MKKIFTLALITFIFTFTCFAQVPQGISYQAIAFTTGGAPVVSSNVGIRISILDNSTSGTVVYAETHTKQTNNKGLFNLNIGQGTPTTGTFAGINWAVNSKFLKVEIDPAGGTSYTSVGTNQLMSVPFALVAGSASNIGTGGNSLNDQLVENKYSNIAFQDSEVDKVFAYSASLNTWSAQSVDPNSNFFIVPTNGNFGFNDEYAHKIYVFNGKTGVWTSQAYNINSSPNLMGDNGNYVFEDVYANKVYSYSAKSGTWSSQSVDPSSNITISVTNGNFAFDDYYAHKVYVFNGATATWSSQSYDPSSSVTIQNANGNFIFEDIYGNKWNVYNAKFGAWSSQSYDPDVSNTSIIVSESN